MQKTSTASIKSSSVEKDSKAAALNPTTIMIIIIKHSLGYLFSYLVGYSLQSPSFHMNAVLWYFGSSVLFFFSCGFDATENEVLRQDSSDPFLEDGFIY